jgi:hypothetical protein
MSTKKIIVLITALILSLMLVFGLVFLLLNRDISDEQILKKFDCSRVAGSYQETDIYCKSPSLYKTGQVSDNEISQQFLGCSKAEADTFAYKACNDKKLFEEYKTNLLASDKRLKSEGCLNTCTSDPKL